MQSQTIELVFGTVPLGADILFSIFYFNVVVPTKHIVKDLSTGPLLFSGVLFLLSQVPGEIMEPGWELYYAILSNSPLPTGVVPFECGGFGVSARLNYRASSPHSLALGPPRLTFLEI